MKSSKVWSQNALALIVGNFLMGLILSIPLIAGVVIFFLSLSEYEYIPDEPTNEMLFQLGIFVFIFLIIAFFFNAFKQAALYTAYNEILVHNKDVSLKQLFSFGFKHYFKYLLTQLGSGAIFVPILSVLTIVPLFVVSPLMDGSGGESIVGLIGYFSFIFIVYSITMPLFIASPFRVAHKGSIKEGIFFPFTAFKKPTAVLKFIGWITLYFVVVTIADQITFGIVSLVVAIFEGVIYMYAYELYLKYFAPKLYKRITEEEVITDEVTEESYELEAQDENESLAEQYDSEKSEEVFEEKEVEDDSTFDKKE